MKKGHSRGSILIFLDESGISTEPLVSRTWAPVGETPTLRYSFSRKKLSVISGVSRGGKLYVKVCKRNIRSDQVIAFLKHLRRHTRRRLVVVWDHGPIHASRETQDFLRENRRWVEAHFLPAYCPELNPDEGFNAQLKYHELKNYSAASFEELKQAVRLAVMRIRAKPWLVRRFFQGCVLFQRGPKWKSVN